MSAVEKTSPWTMYLFGDALYGFSWRCMDPETEGLQNMDGVALFDQDFERAWHSMLNLKHSQDTARKADPCKLCEKAA